jgi:hypothetical protein
VSAEGEAVAGSEDESVVLASFPSRYGAEHMLPSLGRGFRKKFRKRQVAAFVVSRNADDSLKLTQSRYLSGSGLVSALIRVSVAWIVGFLGLFSMLRGAKTQTQAAHRRQANVGWDEQRAHELLAEPEAGPKAAIAVVCCEDRETRETVSERAGETAIRSWDGSRTEFLAGTTRDRSMTGFGLLSESLPARPLRRSLRVISNVR